jgi:hypothetical protein
MRAPEKAAFSADWLVEKSDGTAGVIKVGLIGADKRKSKRGFAHYFTLKDSLSFLIHLR